MARRRIGRRRRRRIGRIGRRRGGRIGRTLLDYSPYRIQIYVLISLATVILVVGIVLVNFLLDKSIREYISIAVAVAYVVVLIGLLIVRNGLKY